MNDLLIHGIITDLADPDPLYAVKPYHYGPTSREERDHLREVPYRRMTLPRIHLPGFVSRIKRANPQVQPECCPAASAA